MRLIKKIVLFLFPIIVSVAFMTTTTSPEEGPEIEIIPQYLKTLGILTGDKKNISNNEFNIYLTNKATKQSAVMAVIRLVSLSNSSENSRASANTFPYNSRIGKISEITPSMSLSSIQAYKYMFAALGYSPSDYRNSDQGVIEFANNIGFGFENPISISENIDNHTFAAILYETMYAKVKQTRQPLYRLLSKANPEFKRISLLSGMIDDLPNYIPLFIYGRYQAGTFKSISDTDQVNKVNKTEWEATYSNVLDKNYSDYKKALDADGWILDTELIKTTSGIDENIVLYYKNINNKEYYCVYKNNPGAKRATVWIGG